MCPATAPPSGRRGPPPSPPPTPPPRPLAGVARWRRLRGPRLRRRDPFAGRHPPVLGPAMPSPVSAPREGEGGGRGLWGDRVRWPGGHRSGRSVFGRHGFAGFPVHPMLERRMSIGSTLPWKRKVKGMDICHLDHKGFIDQINSAKKMKLRSHCNLPMTSWF